jgi:hypothetical protein
MINGIEETFNIRNQYGSIVLSFITIKMNTDGPPLAVLADRFLLNTLLLSSLLISTKGSKTKLMRHCRHLSKIDRIPNGLNFQFFFWLKTLLTGIAL